MFDPYNTEKYNEDYQRDMSGDEDEELLPCPCCGSRAECRYMADWKCWAAICTNRECDFDMRDKFAKNLVARWNDRS